MPERGSLLGALSALGRRPKAGTHVKRKDLCSWPNLRDFWCGRRGGISHRRAWKARADALCVAPAPRDGAGQWTFGAPAVPAKMVEVPNPLKFLG